MASHPCQPASPKGVYIVLSKFKQGLLAFTFTLVAGWVLFAAPRPVDVGYAPMVFGLGVAALVAGVTSALLTWRLFKRIERMVSDRVSASIDDFRRTLSREQAHKEEANRMISTGYSAWFDHQDLEAAIAHFERAVRTFPHGLGGYVALGHAYYRRGETGKAVALFTEAIVRFPHRKEPYRDLAVIHIREGELEEALIYIEEAIRVDPSVRRDLLEDPLFDALRREARTRARFERALAG